MFVNGIRVRNSCYKVILITIGVFYIIICYRFVSVTQGDAENTKNTEPKDNENTRNTEPKVTDYFESYLRLYERKIVESLGKNGEPVKLDQAEMKEVNKSLKTYGMNADLSDRMPLNRTIRDPRNPLCKDNVYNINTKASVIVIFCDELWTVILRTVWSVILQTPEHLLKEIILVDDASSDESLKGLFEYYLKTRLKNYNIKLIRMESRGGLIKARLIGAKAATGDVLVFLDAHCEATVGWMEPLLHRIEQDNTAVVVPIIDTIEADTLEYCTNGLKFHLGGFNWGGEFIWIPLEHDQSNNVTPVKSPTMAGGLFAIHRKFFWDIGSYDEQMEGWGGENLEMSFRIWQCGGRLEIIPCSRVGHIFRKHTPYSPMVDKDTHGINTARLAEVWMDDYKRLFYMNRPDMVDNFLIGDLTNRKQLRERLQCKSFRWYLENVYPEKFIPDEHVYAFGQFMTKDWKCLDDLQLDEGKVGPLGVYSCNNMLGKSQFFSLTLTGQLRTEEFCAAVVNKAVKLTKCDPRRRRQRWMVYKNGTIYHPTTKKCLTAEGIDYGKGVIVGKCSKNPFQKWTFTNVNDTALIV